MNKKSKKPVTSEDSCCQIDVYPGAVRPVFWKRPNGVICGPAYPEFLAKRCKGPKASYWVVARFDECPLWISSSVLRSKQEFESQTSPKGIELIREAR